MAKLKPDYGYVQKLIDDRVVEEYDSFDAEAVDEDVIWLGAQERAVECARWYWNWSVLLRSSYPPGTRGQPVWMRDRYKLAYQEWDSRFPGQHDMPVWSSGADMVDGLWPLLRYDEFMTDGLVRLDNYAVLLECFAKSLPGRGLKREDRKRLNKMLHSIATCVRMEMVAAHVAVKEVENC